MSRARQGAAAALVAATLAAACLAACGGTSVSGEGHHGGGRNDPFYGMVSANAYPTGEMIKRLGAAGVGTLRLNFGWGQVQSGPHAPYDWTLYDVPIATAARSGIHVLATMFGSATWAEPDPEYPPLGTALPGFTAFVRAAVERYGVGGTFWKEHPDMPQLPITHWQLWNEPTSRLYWKPSPNIDHYVQLLRAFHQAVRKAHAGGHVLLGGVFPTPPGDITMANFIKGIYRRGGRGLFDEAAVHPYAPDPASALSSIEELRGLLDDAGDTEKPIWVTEIGWASGGTPSGLTVGPGQQAAYLTRTFELASAARQRLKIAGVIWFALTDIPGPYWPSHAGLFDIDGQPKPAWDALLKLTGGTG